MACQHADHVDLQAPRAPSGELRQRPEEQGNFASGGHQLSPAEQAPDQPPWRRTPPSRQSGAGASLAAQIRYTTVRPTPISSEVKIARATGRYDFTPGQLAGNEQGWRVIEGQPRQYWPSSDSARPSAASRFFNADDFTEVGLLSGLVCTLARAVRRRADRSPPGRVARQKASNYKARYQRHAPSWPESGRVTSGDPRRARRFSATPGLAKRPGTDTEEGAAGEGAEQSST